MPVAQKEKADASYIDYIGNYEKSILDVVEACGGREKANFMLAELREEYEKTNIELKRLKRQFGKDAEKFATEKVKLLAMAQSDVKGIIEKYAPGSADRVRDLVFGTSLAMSAMMVPVTYAVSALSVATSIVSVGHSYKSMGRGTKSAAGGPAFAQQMRGQEAKPPGFTVGGRLPKISRLARKK